ncbi:MAG: hypothetical protein ABSD63_11330 [Candidatus Korobacteraceae bacterium]|jgi:hypothetical protein
MEQPYVTAALLCERVLIEKDGTLSLVRIVDRIQYRIEGEGLPKDIRPIINIQGVVSLKSGPATGDHTIKIVIERPNGERKEVVLFPAKLLGKDQGVNLVLNINLSIDQDGLHWFDVLFDDGLLLTRIPLMVMPLQKEAQPGQLP